ALAAAVAAPLALAACGGSAPDDRASGATTRQKTVTPAPRRVGDIRLTDVAGARPVRRALRARTGGVLVVFFGYASCPDVCPTTLARVASAVRRLGRDARRVEVALITVDPARDTPRVLAGYGRTWFTRGFVALRPATPGELARTERAFGAAHRRVPDGHGGHAIVHSAQVYAVDADGRVTTTWRAGAGVAALRAGLARLLDSDTSTGRGPA
ncbi:MAG: SCO family protein, partial [Actinomycetota bacterium]